MNQSTKRYIETYIEATPIVKRLQGFCKQRENSNTMEILLGLLAFWNRLMESNNSLHIHLRDVSCLRTPAQNKSARRHVRKPGPHWTRVATGIQNKTVV